MSITEVPHTERVLHDCRDAYAATLVELAEADPRVVAVVEVNGHDHAELFDVLSSVPFRPGKPTFVIAHTHKGHPISYMSNNVAWHHKVPSADQLELALNELEATRTTDSREQK